MSYEDDAISTYPIEENGWRTLILKHDAISELYSIEIITRELDTVHDTKIYLSPLEMENIIRAVRGKIIPLEQRDKR